MSVSFDPSFVSLKRELEQASGSFFRKADTEKMAKVVDTALQLSLETPNATQEEFEFYQAANKRVTPSYDRMDSLKSKVEDAAKGVMKLEKLAKEVSRQFHSKNETQQVAFLHSDVYRVVGEESAAYDATLEKTTNKILDLLYKPVKGSKTTPFQDLETFAKHRDTVSELYNSALDLRNRHAVVLAALSPEGLYASDKGSILARHPYSFSIPLGATLAAAGAYFGTSTALKALGIALGTVAAASPFAFSSSES